MRASDFDSDLRTRNDIVYGLSRSRGLKSDEVKESARWKIPWRSLVPRNANCSLWGEVTASLTPQRKTHENQERVGIIGINIRPATTTVALADLDAHFVAQESLPTAGTPQQFIAELVPRIRKLIKTVAKVSVVD